MESFVFFMNAIHVAFIVEAAGGRASNGKKRIVELQPEKLHQRTPIFIGSEHDVLKVEEFIAKEEKEKEELSTQRS